jgi:hypothetical protein
MKYLKKLSDSLHDADLVGVEFLLIWIGFSLAMLVALGLEQIIYRIVTR